MKKFTVYLLMLLTSFSLLIGQVVIDDLTGDNATSGNASGEQISIASIQPTATGTRQGNVINASVLNVRTAPWGTIIGKLNRNDSVTITGESSDGRWYKIDYNGREAYVYKSYIRAGEVTPVETPTTQTGTITAGTLNVRTSVWGTIIGTVRRNQTFALLEESQGWYKINYNGRDGWISGRYVRVGGSTTNETPGEDTPPLSGDLGGSQYGYDPEVFAPVLEEIRSFCDSNQAYVLGQGHQYSSGYASRTDCSGFTAQFYQKLARRAGVEPVIPYNSWTPVSTAFQEPRYTERVTTQFPPTNPRDLIRPGDIFVMNRGSANYGHIGVFVGYNSAGEPLIAHSTTSRIDSNDEYGNIGRTGVRIEPMPRRYQDRYAGMFRFNNMDQILNNLRNS